MTPISFNRNRFPPIIIQHTIWLYARFAVIDDCGAELNPLLVKGQVHGGITHGAGA